MSTIPLSCRETHTLWAPCSPTMAAASATFLLLYAPSGRRVLGVHRKHTASSRSIRDYGEV